MNILDLKYKYGSFEEQSMAFGSDVIRSQIVDCKEKLIKAILKDYLQRNPTLIDYQETRLVSHITWEPGIEQICYKGLGLGVIKTTFYNNTVNFRFEPF